MEKRKETIVTSKVKSNAVNINKCVPITNEELTEIIECSQVGKYNFINVTLTHTDDVRLTVRCNQFISKIKNHVSLTLLQKAGLYERRYTIVTNKGLYKIANVIAQAQAEIHNETNDHRFEIKY